ESVLAYSRSAARCCCSKTARSFGVRFAQSVTVSDASSYSYAVTSRLRNEVSVPSGSVGRTTSGGAKSVSMNDQYCSASFVRRADRASIAASSHRCAVFTSALSRYGEAVKPLSSSLFLVKEDLEYPA